MMENVMESNFNIYNMEAPVPESRYAPLNLEEFQQLKAQLDTVVHHLPEHLLGNFWSLCNRIRNENVRQPCSCRSSAKHWGNCVNDLKAFVKSKSE
jgi:hypothetical protein